MKNLLEYLEYTATVLPEKIFLTDGKTSVTFQEALVKAKSIGTFLAKRGYEKQFLAVMAEKTPKTVLLFLGCLYAGCAYVPIDPEMPGERRSRILSRGKCSVILSEKAVKGDFPCLFYDDLQTQPDEVLLNKIREKQIDTDPTYAVFTSGSTGEPKGVVGCHRGVIDYTEALCRALPFSQDTVFGNQTPLFFDAPLKELMPAMKLGGTVHFIPKMMFSFPMALCTYIKENNINTLCWVVSAFTMISSLGVLEENPPTTVKCICFASEVFPRNQYDLWRKTLPEATFYNLYGPTEATGVSCFWRCDRELSPDEPIPCGKPFHNTDLLIVKGRHLAKRGEVGEIYIRGTCLCFGYLGQPDVTKKAFVQNPVQKDYPELCYRTGDLGYLNDRGELVFVGRKDDQIKMMGHRVELGEIESAAYQCPDLSRCCCLYDNEKKQIYLFYEGKADIKSVQETLTRNLPPYMVPKQIVKLDKIPKTPNGKNNKTALKALFQG